MMGSGKNRHFISALKWVIVAMWFGGCVTSETTVSKSISLEDPKSTQGLLVEDSTGYDLEKIVEQLTSEKQNEFANEYIEKLKADAKIVFPTNI